MAVASSGTDAAVHAETPVNESSSNFPVMRNRSGTNPVSTPQRIDFDQDRPLSRDHDFKSHSGERCGNVETIPAGTVERGERKRTVDDLRGSVRRMS
jgi:hypothetical protein